jgi:cobalamin biosynthesis protein CobT
MDLNIFSNAMETVCRALSNDPTLKFVYANIPNSRGASYQFPPVNAMTLPRVNVNHLTREQQITWTANQYHELRHHALSCKEALDKTFLEKRLIIDLTNAIEDARIELSPEYIAYGMKECLDQDRQWEFEETGENYSKLVHTNQPINFFGWLNFVILYNLLGYGTLPIKDEMIPYLDVALDILHDGRFNRSITMGKQGHYTSLNLAKDIFNAWQKLRDQEKEEEKNQKNQQQENSDKNQQGQNDQKDNKSNQSGKGNEEESNNEESEENQDKKSKSKSKNKNNKNQDKNEEGEPGKKDAQGQSKEDRESDNDDTGNGNNADGNVDADTDSDDEGKGGDKTGKNSGNDENNESDNDGHDKGRSNSVKEADINEEYENAQGNKETNIDTEKRSKKVAAYGKPGDEKEFNEFIESLIKKDHRNPFGHFLSYNRASAGDPYIPYNALDREIIPDLESDKMNFENAFEQILAEVDGTAQFLQGELSVMLRSLSENRTVRGLRRGRLDPHAYHKLVQGSRYVKYQVFEGIDISTAVTLLIDLSGSMAGYRAELAVKVAIAFGQALASFYNIPLEIRGYNSSPLVGGDGLFGKSIHCETKENELRDRGFTRTEIINHWIFKRFDEDWNTVRYRLGACAGELDHSEPEKYGCVGGCNVDHENLLAAAYSLSRRQEHKKVLIVLCDGAPSGYNHTYGGLLERELNFAIQKIREAGIKLFCYGMMTDDVKKFYDPNVEILHNLQSLDSKALIKLSELLLKP